MCLLVICYREQSVKRRTLTGGCLATNVCYHVVAMLIENLQTEHNDGLMFRANRYYV